MSASYFMQHLGLNIKISLEKIWDVPINPNIHQGLALFYPQADGKGLTRACKILPVFFFKRRLKGIDKRMKL